MNTAGKTQREFKKKTVYWYKQEVYVSHASYYD